ncbi:MAG: hypothetical protein HY062_14450 [Bacteroidetes bacterium]|nr:hypothetical protein [Bacteroidota bacterium]
MDNIKANEVPVVFIHFGDIPEYLVNAITQAASFGNKVYLVTNNSSLINDAELIDSTKINTDESLFKSYYKHMSSNSYQFEYICMYRWYILKNFMKEYNIDRVLYLDSDVYLYAHTSHIAANYPVFDFAFNVPEDQDNCYWAGSACCSIWTSDAITRFCEKITSYYTTDAIETLSQKWKYHTDHHILGGICDMTFLYFFSKESGFFNLGKVYNGYSFDFNNASSANLVNNEYRFKQGTIFQIPTKDISFKDGMPYGVNLMTGKSVCFYALTEYAKLLALSKRQSLLTKLKYIGYNFKAKLFN